MKKQGVIFGLALWGMAALALGQVQVGVGVGVGGDSFHLAIGSYYNVPPAQVAVVQQGNIPDEEQPVVFFVANRIHVAPGVIIDMRAHGMSWVDIFHRYRISPRVLYVPLRGGWAGTPYAGFYGYYRGRGRLVDADIVNMVNLRFASDYYHRPPGEIIRMRAAGHDFRYIHDQYRRPHPGHADDHHFDHHDDHRDGDWH